MSREASPVGGGVQVDEPYGHDDHLSKFERAWAEAEPGHALARTRTQRFDVHSSLLYSPMVYEHAPVTVDVAQPSTEWIAEEFIRFVRTEFPSRITEPDEEPILPAITEKGTCRFDLIDDYLSTCESQLLYGGPVRSIQEASTNDMVTDVIRVLTHPLIGHKENAQNLDPDALRTAVDEQVQRKGRLLFVVPACPFKDQNPLRTLGPASFPDAGEVSFLTTLHTLALALYQVHPFGADCVILSDGDLYASVFGVEAAEAAAYQERLRTFRNRLNMQGTVSVIDLSAIIDRFAASAGRDRFEDVIGLIRRRVGGFADTDGELAAAFKSLVQAMGWNLSTRAMFEDCDEQTVWQVLTAPTPTGLPRAVGELWDGVHARAVDAAIEYATINLTMRWFRVIETMLVGSIRATVHPKLGQLAIRALGSAYPWNATAFRRSSEINPLMFQAKPLYELRDYSPLRAVFLEGYSELTPFYLERS